MLHRLAALLIILFWMGMTGLLLERKYSPESSRFNHVPPEHLRHLVFQHEQVSDLNIYKDKKSIGLVRFMPVVDRENRLRYLDISGTLKFSIGGAPEIPLSWHSRTTMEADYRVKTVEIDLNSERVRQAEVLIDKTGGKDDCTIKGLGLPPEGTTFKMDRNGFAMLFKQMGIDPGMIAQFQGTQKDLPPPTFSAQQSSVVLNGENIATYLLSFKLGDQTLFTLHLSQVGQALRGDCPALGYMMLPQGVPPAM